MPVPIVLEIILYRRLKRNCILQKRTRKNTKLYRLILIIAIGVSAGTIKIIKIYYFQK